MWNVCGQPGGVDVNGYGRIHVPWPHGPCLMSHAPCPMSHVLCPMSHVPMSHVPMSHVPCLPHAPKPHAPMHTVTILLTAIVTLLTTTLRTVMGWHRLDQGHGKTNVVSLRLLTRPCLGQACELTSKRDPRTTQLCVICIVTAILTTYGLAIFQSYSKGVRLSSGRTTRTISVVLI